MRFLLELESLIAMLALVLCLATHSPARANDQRSILSFAIGRGDNVAAYTHFDLIFVGSWNGDSKGKSIGFPSFIGVKLCADFPEPAKGADEFYRLREFILEHGRAFFKDQNISDVFIKIVTPNYNVAKKNQILLFKCDS